jgi:hypothetical protein
VGEHDRASSWRSRQRRREAARTHRKGKAGDIQRAVRAVVPALLVITLHDTESVAGVVLRPHRHDRKPRLLS